MIRRAIDHWYRREHRPRVYAPRCGLCGKAWPIPTETALVPSSDSTRAYEAPVCADHLTSKDF